MLEEEIALITGASRGISCQIALILGREGAAIIMNYNDSATEAEEVVKEIEVAGGRAEAVQRSVFDFESCGRMAADMIPRYGHPDILVNNTGVIKDSLLMKMSEEDFDAIIGMNLKGVLNCIKHIFRQMLKQKAGRITNISSISGVLGNAGQANYCAAKAGVIGITKPAARKLASRGIMVNAVAPGSITTEMTDALSDSVKAAATEQIPMKYFGSTQDIAETVAFLASDKAGYIIGQVLSVDGGVVMWDAPVYIPGCKKTGMRLVRKQEQQ